MAFNVGDRVEFIGPFPVDFRGAIAVVGRTHRSSQSIFVHFDDPKFEARQMYDAGWSAENFRLAYDEPVIEEDWS